MKITVKVELAKVTQDWPPPESPPPSLDGHVSGHNSKPSDDPVIPCGGSIPGHPTSHMISAQSMPSSLTTVEHE